MRRNQFIWRIINCHFCDIFYIDFWSWEEFQFKYQMYEFDNYSISPQATLIEMTSILKNVRVLTLGLNHLDDPDYATENRDWWAPQQYTVQLFDRKW